MVKKAAVLWNLGVEKTKGKIRFSMKRAVITQKWEGLFYLGNGMGGYKGIPR